MQLNVNCVRALLYLEGALSKLLQAVQRLWIEYCRYFIEFQIIKFKLLQYYSCTPSAPGSANAPFAFRHIALLVKSQNLIRI